MYQQQIFPQNVDKKDKNLFRSESGHFGKSGPDPEQLSASATLLKNAGSTLNGEKIL
jgi:hypothetical protein